MKSCWPEAESMPQCGQLSKDCPIKREMLTLALTTIPFSSYPSKEINGTAKCYPADSIARMYVAADREAAADGISLSTTAFVKIQNSGITPL